MGMESGHIILSHEMKVFQNTQKGLKSWSNNSLIHGRTQVLIFITSE
jgi:hypothetical protein